MFKTGFGSKEDARLGFCGRLGSNKDDDDEEKETIVEEKDRKGEKKKRGV